MSEIPGPRPPEPISSTPSSIPQFEDQPASPPPVEPFFESVYPDPTIDIDDPDDED